MASSQLVTVPDVSVSAGVDGMALSDVGGGGVTYPDVDGTALSSGALVSGANLVVCVITG